MTVRTSPAPNQQPALPDFIMKAVILCENCAFAVKARSILQLVGERPDVSIHWTILFWPLNALYDAAMSTQALAESIDAHLILISSEYAKTFPSHLRIWLERWATMRSLDEAALGVIGTLVTDTLETPSSETLRKLIKDHGLHLISAEAFPADLRITE